MGLLDVLRGMANGPRGDQGMRAPSSGGGMSPLTMGLLALLAYKAFKGGGLGNIFGQTAPAGPGPMQAIRCRQRGRRWRKAGKAAGCRIGSAARLAARWRVARPARS